MQSKLIRAALAAALVPVFATGCSLSNAAPAPLQAVPAASAGRAMPDFTQLVQQAGPAVVNISVTKQAAAQAPLGEDDPLAPFLRRFQVPAPQERPVRGIGSGFIISPEGYILTNAHVVDGVKEVHVKLTDRREFTAKVVGADPKSDVALVKIDGAGLPAVHIGDSKQVKVGQWVAAVGAPFGFENSVTAGIVSATSRALPGDSYVPFIQTDVAVNPGNSGGPLFDMAGNVVGINSQIYSQSGGYMGLSFAIPIDVAMHVKDELQQHGHVTRGRIGLAVQPVNQSLAQSFGLSAPRGALVSSIEDNAPAAQAGIRPGDVIVAWNGTKVEESASLPALVAGTAPGSHANVTVWRDGAEHTLGVTVGRMSEEKVAANSTGPSQANTGRLGLAVHSDSGGIVVDDVSGPAANAGVRPGDTIVAVNSQKVGSVDELRRLVDKAGKHVALLVQRGEMQRYVPIDLG
jgi:serine protease Do